MILLWGGQVKPHSEAQEDSWRKILSFLRHHLYCSPKATPWITSWEKADLKSQLENRAARPGHIVLHIFLCFKWWQINKVGNMKVPQLWLFYWQTVRASWTGSSWGGFILTHSADPHSTNRPFWQQTFWGTTTGEANNINEGCSILFLTNPRRSGSRINTRKRLTGMGCSHQHCHQLHLWWQPNSAVEMFIEATSTKWLELWGEIWQRFSGWIKLNPSATNSWL